MAAALTLGETTSLEESWPTAIAKRTRRLAQTIIRFRALKVGGVFPFSRDQHILLLYSALDHNLGHNFWPWPSWVRVRCALMGVAVLRVTSELGKFWSRGFLPVASSATAHLPIHEAQAPPTMFGWSGSIQEMRDAVHVRAQAYYEEARVQEYLLRGERGGC